MSEDRIPPGPLDPGDEFKIDVRVESGYRSEDANAYAPDDTVTVTLPHGKGMVFAAWLHRQMTETPELREARHQADQLAELKAAS